MGLRQALHVDPAVLKDPVRRHLCLALLARAWLLAVASPCIPFTIGVLCCTKRGRGHLCRQPHHQIPATTSISKDGHVALVSGEWGGLTTWSPQGWRDRRSAHHDLVRPTLPGLRCL